MSHHFIRPLWARTTWNSWMRSRFVACVSSMRSVSPRVPTVEKARSSRWDAKSSHAAMNSRLCDARSAASSRRHAGSTFRNVYLTKWRSGTRGSLGRPLARVDAGEEPREPEREHGDGDAAEVVEHVVPAEVDRVQHGQR